MTDLTIYPAIDLRSGKVVRLKEGDPTRQKTYSDDPGDIARRWLEAGAGWLHVVNLDGAFGKIDSTNLRALQVILNATRKHAARVQFGGGIRTLEIARRALDLGVDRVIFGTVAIEQPQMILDALKEFGVDKIAIAIDAREELVQIRGWQSGSEVNAQSLVLQMQDFGVRTIIFTDISRDGVGSGLNIKFTRQLSEASGLDVIASGGVNTINDVIAARNANLAGVIIGRALYEGLIDLRFALETKFTDPQNGGPC